MLSQFTRSGIRYYLMYLGCKYVILALDMDTLAITAKESPDAIAAEISNILGTTNARARHSRPNALTATEATSLLTHLAQNLFARGKYKHLLQKKIYQLLRRVLDLLGSLLLPRHTTEQLDLKIIPSLTELKLTIHIRVRPPPPPLYKAPYTQYVDYNPYSFL